MIDRLEATQLVAELGGGQPIVAGLSNASFDLAALDRPLNVYMWNSMGQASSSVSAHGHRERSRAVRGGARLRRAEGRRRG